MGTALLILVLILLLFGGGALSTSINILWYLLVAALIVWALGFIVRSAEGGGRWYRW
jgi:hypothetical protein